MLGVLVGRWNTVSEFQLEPGGPLQHAKGIAVGRATGGPWVVVEHTGDHDGVPFRGTIVLGEDAATHTFTGVWFDSLSAALPRYQGSFDSAHQVLTLETKVRGPDASAAEVPIRDQLSIVGPDQLVWTTTARNGDAWVPVVTVRYQRQR